MCSGPQIRAARALLAMSAAELAAAANVDLRTVQRFEAQTEVPASRSGTLERIRQALEDRGVEFIGDPEHSPGVRLRERRG